MDEVQVACGLEWTVSEAEKRLVCLADSSFLQEPTRRFGAEIDTNEKRNCWEERTSVLQSPCNVTSIDEHQVGACAKEDSKGCPHLPGHDETSSNIGWSALSGVDGNSNFLQTHADTKQSTCRNELTPFLRECHAEGSAETEDRGYEDGTSTGEKIVERVGKPGGADIVSSDNPLAVGFLQDSNGDIRSGVNKTNDPRVLVADSFGRALRSGAGDAQSLAECQIGSIGSCAHQHWH